MQRICFCLRIKTARIEEYKQRHRTVWPEMLDALSRAGWRNYSLFLRDDGLLIGYFETDDFDRALKEMAAKEVNSRWQRDMAPFFENSGGMRPDEAMQPLAEVFHLA